MQLPRRAHGCGGIRATGDSHVFCVPQGVSLPTLPSQTQEHGTGRVWDNLHSSNTHPRQVLNSSMESPFNAGCSSPFLPVEMQQQEAVAPCQSPSASACLLLAIFGESLQVLPHSEQVTSWLWPTHLSQSNEPGQSLQSAGSVPKVFRDVWLFPNLSAQAVSCLTTGS